VRSKRIVEPFPSRRANSQRTRANVKCCHCCHAREELRAKTIADARRAAAASRREVMDASGPYVHRKTLRIAICVELACGDAVESDDRRIALSHASHDTDAFGASAQDGPRAAEREQTELEQPVKP
jgi:hypothetical protein